MPFAPDATNLPDPNRNDLPGLAAVAAHTPP